MGERGGEKGDGGGRREEEKEEEKKQYPPTEMSPEHNFLLNVSLQLKLRIQVLIKLMLYKLKN